MVRMPKSKGFGAAYGGLGGREPNDDGSLRQIAAPSGPKFGFLTRRSQVRVLPGTVPSGFARFAGPAALRAWLLARWARARARVLPGSLRSLRGPGSTPGLVARPMGSRPGDPSAKAG